MPGSKTSAHITDVQESLAEAQLCEHLEKRIILTARAVFSFKTYSVLLSTLPDGTPVAQLVYFDSGGTFVLMEEQGFPSSEIGRKRRSKAMHNLLDAMEALWGAVCGLGKSKRKGIYYVPSVTAKKNLEETK